MHFKWTKKLIAYIVTVAMIFSVAPTVFAQTDTDDIEIILTDVTQDDQTTLGEAKIKVTVKGNVSSANIIQASFTFSGNLKYNATEYLLGSDNTSQGKIWQTTGESSANSTGAFTATIISVNESLPLNGETDAFIISFIGNPGETVTLNVDKQNTYVKLGDAKHYANNSATASASASATAKEPLNATVKLVMDKVSGFSANSERPVTVEITNERTQKSVSVIVNDSNRIAISPLTYEINQKLIKDDTYTVEVSANGYIPYVVNNYSFAKELKVDNTNFVPGDVNGDEKVDAADKKAYLELIKEKKYSAKADFNCDGKTDDLDDVFEGIVIEDDQNTPSSGEGSGDDTTTGGTTGGNESGSGQPQLPGAGGSSGSSSGGGFSGGSSFGGGFGGVTTPSVNEPFTDLGNHLWAKDSIYILKNKGIISGVSATEYAPANNIRRGDFILILVRMLGINNAYSENFADVPANSYYYDAIGKAKAAGIATGDGINFMPENSITRQDLITLAYRAFLNLGYISETTDTSVLNSFADSSLISPYAASPMASMVNAGIIKGDNGNVNPLGNATRAEVAVMCARLLALVK